MRYRDIFLLYVICIMGLLMVIQYRIHAIYSGPFFKKPSYQKSFSMNEFCETGESFQAPGNHYYLVKDKIIEKTLSDNNIELENFSLFLFLLDKNDTQVFKKLLQVIDNSENKGAIVLKMATTNYTRDLHDLLLKFRNEHQSTSIGKIAKEILHLRLVAVAGDKLICKTCNLEPYIFYNYLTIFDF